GQDLPRPRLAGAGRTGDQAMAIAEPEIERFVLVALADDDRVVGERRGNGALVVRSRGRGAHILSLGRRFPSHCCLRSLAVRGGGLALFYSVTLIGARWRRAHFGLVLSWGSSRPKSGRRRGLARTSGCKRCRGRYGPA